MYAYSADEEMKEEKRNASKRCILDADERILLNEKFMKHSHPLKTTSSSFYDIAYGKVKNASVTVVEAL